jgi:hypothetical protein
MNNQLFLMMLFVGDFFQLNDHFLVDDYQEYLMVILEMTVELIEDDYLMQHIVFDYQNRRLLKEKRRFELQKLLVDEQSEEEEKILK